MLGILMGLIAWVADAVISWNFSAGEPFHTFLISFHPDKTLYVRSVVVMLFFIFGLVCGHLVYRLELSNKREKRHNLYLEGIRSIHRVVGHINHEETLCEQMQLEMISVFGLEHVMIRLVDPQPLKDPLPAQAAEEFQQVSGCDLMMKDWIGAHPKSELHEDCLCGLIGFQDDLLGFYSIQSQQFLDRQLASGLRMSVENLMEDLAQAVVRIRDHAGVEEKADKLKALYTNAPVGIFSSTVQGRLLFLNQRMAEYLGGNDPEEVLNQVESTHRFYSQPGSREQFLSMLKRGGDVTQIQNPLKGLDEKVRKLVFYSRLTGQEVEGDEVIEGFVIDETSSLEMQDRNRTLEENLVKARHYESVAGLASGVAHEFNNILQAMMGSAYLVQMGTEKETPAWNYLQDIQNSGNRAGRLCDQMLTYAGKKAVVLREEPMDDVLAAFRLMLKSNLPDTVSFRMNLDADGTRARIDRASFSELIRNLVVNAAEAIGEDGGEITMYSCEEPLTESLCQRYGLAGKESEDPHWTLRVRDTGDGMKAETLRRAFDPFFSTKFQGRGLGLAAAKGAVEKFDGKLGVSTRPGMGTEFFLALPVSFSVEVLEEEAQPAKPKVVPVFRSSGSVWVVDDEPLICETMSRFIISWGLTCETATESTDAVKRMLEVKDSISCLILDVTMPGKDGVEVMRDIREVRPDLPVILMSGFSEEETLRKFEDQEVSGFIHKPFQASVLEGHLRRALDADTSAA